jgi:hypothetical protein
MHFHRLSVYVLSCAISINLLFDLFILKLRISSIYIYIEMTQHL